MLPILFVLLQSAAEMREHAYDAPSVKASRSAPAPRRPEPRSRCWQDYCPCDEEGPVDKILCRNLRGGVAVSPEMFSSGAAMRDARESIRQWNRDNPGNAVPLRN